MLHYFQKKKNWWIHKYINVIEIHYTDITSTVYVQVNLTSSEKKNPMKDIIIKTQ